MRMIPEKLADLSESDRRAIMGRSMEDISSLYEYVRNPTVNTASTPRPRTWW